MEPARNPPSARRGTRRLWPLYALLVAIVVLLIAIAGSLPRPNPPPVALPDLGLGATPRGEAAERSREPSGSIERSPVLPRLPPLPGSSSIPTARSAAFAGALVFVIDDVGNNIDELEAFLRIPDPLTFSVLPRLPDTKAAYERIVQAGKQAILHQPMEAESAASLGPGAILVSMGEGEIDAALAENLEGMPEITWMNNHEGSKATADPRTMGYVLAYLRARGMHFLDSRTTQDSAVESVSSALGLRYYSRNGPFLDDQVERNAILSEIDAGLAVARKEGYAVMIGHVWDRELPGILSERIPELRGEGFRLEELSALGDEGGTAQ